MAVFDPFLNLPTILEQFVSRCERFSSQACDPGQRAGNGWLKTVERQFFYDGPMVRTNWRAARTGSGAPKAALATVRANVHSFTSVWNRLR